jgi:hypothetical protein
VGAARRAAGRPGDRPAPDEGDPLPATGAEGYWAGRQPVSPELYFGFPNRLPQGEYSIALFDAKGAALPIEPWLPLPQTFPFEKVVLAGPGLGLNEAFSICPGLLYSFVPEGTDDLDLFSRGGDTRNLAVLRVERPGVDGWENVAQVGSIMWPEKQLVTARVRPADRGKVWRFFHTSALVDATRAEGWLWLRTPKVPFVVADQPGRFFVPRRSLMQQGGSRGSTDP